MSTGVTDTPARTKFRKLEAAVGLVEDPVLRVRSTQMMNLLAPLPPLPRFARLCGRGGAIDQKYISVFGWWKKILFHVQWFGYFCFFICRRECL